MSLSPDTFDTSPFARSCDDWRSKDELPVSTQISSNITSALPPELPQCVPQFRVIPLLRAGEQGLREKRDKREMGNRSGTLKSLACAATKSRFFSARIRLVHPEDGLTGVLLIETDKPTTRVEPTAEEVQEVREGMERRRAARLLWNGGPS